MGKVIKRGIGIFLVLICILASLAGVARYSKKKKANTDIGVLEKRYTIGYFAVSSATGKQQLFDGDYAFMLKEDGNYPTSYTSAETVVISDLKTESGGYSQWNDAWNAVWNDALENIPIENETKQASYSVSSVLTPIPDPKNNNHDAIFYGWYLDEACSEAFDGKIRFNSSGNIVLYAKISDGYWTNSYGYKSYGLTRRPKGE